MAKERYASARPSKAEAGGDFGFPSGAVVEITEAAWKNAEEAGEKFVGTGDGEDPVLHLIGDVEGMDEPKDVFLRAGKGTRLRASDDGEHLVIPEGSSASAISSSSNANIFLESITSKKLHGKMAFPEEAIDDGISCLVGLKFVAGRKVVEREGLDDGDGKKKPRPTLIAEDIVKLPKGLGSGGGSGKAKDADEEDRPKKKTGKGKVAKKEPEEEDDDEDDDSSDKDELVAQTETTVLAVLGSSKWKKTGLPEDKVFSEVFNKVRGEDNRNDIVDLVKDDDWMQHADRPWAYDKKKEVFELVE